MGKKESNNYNTVFAIILFLAGFGLFLGGVGAVAIHFKAELLAIAAALIIGGFFLILIGAALLED